MPSVYDYKHIELNNVGRGKKRISISSADGGMKEVLTTPTKPPHGGWRKLSLDGSNGSTGSSPTGSRPASRRGSRSEDTQTKLFGPPVRDSPRKVKDLFKSSVFANQVSPPASPQKVATPRAVYTPVRRNPITGEVLGSSTPAASKVTTIPVQVGPNRVHNNGIKNGNGSICSLSSLSSTPSN